MGQITLPRGPAAAEHVLRTSASPGAAGSL